MWHHIAMADELLTVDEVAGRMKLHPDTIRRLLRKGELRGAKFGAQDWRIRASDLQEYIDQKFKQSEKSSS